MFYPWLGTGQECSVSHNFVKLAQSIFSMIAIAEKDLLSMWFTHNYYKIHKTAVSLFVPTASVVD